MTGVAGLDQVVVRRSARKDRPGLDTGRVSLYAMRETAGCRCTRCRASNDATSTLCDTRLVADMSKAMFQSQNSCHRTYFQSISRRLSLHPSSHSSSCYETPSSSVSPPPPPSATAPPAASAPR